jgi:hypothetical protein
MPEEDGITPTPDELDEVARQEELAKSIQKWSERHDCNEANCTMNPQGEKILKDRSNAQTRGPKPE